MNDDMSAVSQGALNLRDLIKSFNVPPNGPLINLCDLVSKLALKVKELEVELEQVLDTANSAHNVASNLANGTLPD